MHGRMLRGTARKIRDGTQFRYAGGAAGRRSKDEQGIYFEIKITVMYLDLTMPYKVADISLAGWGRKEDRDRRARNARTDGRACRGHGPQKPLKGVRVMGPAA